jgi:hypothetical protein
MILARPARASRITIAHRDPARAEAVARAVRSPLVIRSTSSTTGSACLVEGHGGQIWVQSEAEGPGDESLRQKQPTC